MHFLLLQEAMGIGILLTAIVIAVFPITGICLLIWEWQKKRIALERPLTFSDWVYVFLNAAARVLVLFIVFVVLIIILFWNVTFD